MAKTEREGKQERNVQGLLLVSMRTPPQPRSGTLVLGGHHIGNCGQRSLMWVRVGGGFDRYEMVEHAGVSS